MGKKVDVQNNDSTSQNIPTIIQEYNEFVSGFQKTALLNGEWEKKGDEYVQFSFYDESKIGCSAACFTGSMTNV